MDVYKIVDAFSKAIDIGGTFVIHRNMTVNKVKIYKTFNSTLWLIRKGHKYRILTVLNIERVPDKQIEEFWDIHDMQVVVELFKLTRDGIEQILDSYNTGVTGEIPLGSTGTANGDCNNNSICEEPNLP